MVQESGAASGDVAQTTSPEKPESVAGSVAGTEDDLVEIVVPEDCVPGDKFVAVFEMELKVPEGCEGGDARNLPKSGLQNARCCCMPQRSLWRRCRIMLYPKQSAIPIPA